MNAKKKLQVAVLLASFCAALTVGPHAQAAVKVSDYSGFTALTCDPGYHLGPNGNCQPKYARPSRCAAGYMSQVFPNGNGYRCVRIPRGY